MDVNDPAALLAEIQGIQENLHLYRQTLSQDIVSTASSRTPEKSARDNTADVIEQRMQRAGHTVWGLVIYRCDYGSEAQWSQGLIRIREGIEQTLHQNNGIDLLDGLRITVMENEDYANQSPSEIRSHFRRWREQAVVEEQNHPATDADFFTPRYAYCVQVDSGSLRSITDTAGSDRQAGGEQGYVNVISATQGHETGARPEYYEDLRDDDFDTGWMRVPCESLVDFAWYWVGDTNAWYTEYRPPPQVHSG